MTEITINNITQRLYTLEEIKERSQRIRVDFMGAAAPFSYAAYAGALEINYTLLREFVERIAEAAKTV